MTPDEKKELDDFINFVELELLPENCDKKRIREAMQKYADLWHLKMMKKNI